MVPGVAYVTFLTEILDFLAENSSEIVMIESKSDGFVSKVDKLKPDGTISVYSMIPDIAELAECMVEARKLAKTDAGRAVLVSVLCPKKDYQHLRT